MKDNSILDDIKQMLSLEKDDDSFDIEVMIHINTAFSLLNQIGAAPVDGFEIDDSSTKWSDFFGDLKNVGLVKSYIYFKVRLAFDPPSTSFTITAFETQMKELEWRINALEFVFNPKAYDSVLANNAGNADTTWIIDETQPLPEGMKAGEVGVDLTTGTVVRKT